MYPKARSKQVNRAKLLADWRVIMSTFSRGPSRIAEREEPKRARWDGFGNYSTLSLKPYIVRTSNLPCCCVVLAAIGIRAWSARFACHQTNAKAEKGPEPDFIKASQLRAPEHQTPLRSLAFAVASSIRRRRPSLRLCSSPRSSCEPATCHRSPTTTHRPSRRVRRTAPRDLQPSPCPRSTAP